MRLLLSLLFALPPAAAAVDWPYSGGPDQTRYSPLTQITPANVSGLKVAWSYDTGDAFAGSEMQCQPVVARGVLYAASPEAARVRARRRHRRPEVELRPEPGRT